MQVSAVAAAASVQGGTGFQSPGLATLGSTRLSLRTNFLTGTGRLENVSVSAAGCPNGGPSTDEIAGAPPPGGVPFTAWTPTPAQVHGNAVAELPKTSCVCWRTVLSRGDVWMVAPPASHVPSAFVPSTIVTGSVIGSGGSTLPPPLAPVEPASNATDTTTSAFWPAAVVLAVNVTKRFTSWPGLTVPTAQAIVLAAVGAQSELVAGSGVRLPTVDLKENVITVCVAAP